MTDTIAVIAEMSWWVKGAWLVWLAWLTVQVAWYRWGRIPAADNVPAILGRADTRRPVPVDTMPHPAAAAAHASTSSHRRRQRQRRAAAAASDLTDGVEAAR
jgi:hypothetical protein